MTGSHRARLRLLVTTARDYEANAVLELATDRSRLELAGHVTESGYFGTTEVSAVVADVGPLASGMVTADVLRVDQTFDAVLSAGIAGAFPSSRICVGDLVVGTHLHHADFGAETEAGFVAGEEFDWPDASIECDRNLVDAISRCTGGQPGPILTVTRQSASPERVRHLCEAWPNPLAEAMEGIGVASAANRVGLPATEIRGISNLVGPRASNPWNKPAALAALTKGFSALGSLHLPAGNFHNQAPSFE